jgi:pilus assembly protein Flp/PilA
MNRIQQLIDSFVEDEQGATALEYALLAAAIAAVIAATVILVGNKLPAGFDSVVIT